MNRLDAIKAQSLIVTFRYEIIRDIRTLAKVLSCLFILIVIDIFAVKNYLSNVAPGYVAVENDGQELNLKRLSESPFPELTLESEQASVKAIALDCMDRILTTDTLNYLADFQDASSCFSSNTYSSFTTTLVQSGFIKLLKNNEVWLGTSDTKEAVIERKLVGGRLTWFIDTPFQLKRYTQEGNKYLNLQLRIRVSRMNSLEYKNSLAITQVVMNNV